jgi:peroxiredoxin
MKVIGDVDNKLFFENILFNKDRHEEADPFIKVLEDSTLKDDQKKNAREEFAKINKKVLAYQDELIAKYPATITAKLLKATKQIEIPDPPKLHNGKVDSTFQLRYYRQHFFDYFDVADDALMKMPKPFYQEKVKEYLEKLFLPQPDTIMKAIDGLVAKAKKNTETYKFMVYSCLVIYQNPEIMGLDEVYVRLYDKYFATGEMDFWANAPFKKSLKDYADKVRRAMIGRTAPNLIMQDQSLQPKSLYDIKKRYTIVYFFDPDCSHCRKESPKLVDFYNNNKSKYDLEVYAVASDTSMKKMRDYIKEMKMSWITVNGPRSYTKEHFSLLYFTETFPTVYVLDDKKKIIARKIPVDKIDDFLTNYEKFQKKKPVAIKG